MPPGFAKDPNHLDYTGSKLVIAASICSALSTIFVAMRVFVRLFVQTYFGLNNLLIIFAWVYMID